MSELLLIQTPYIDDYGPMKKAAGTYFPLGLGYISAYVKQHCYDAKLLDPNVQDVCLDDITQVVLQNKPLIAGMSFMTPQIESARKICHHIRQVAPETCIVLGGVHPTVMPKQTLQHIPDADIAVIGEGEQTTLQLLQTISQGENAFEKISGLCLRRNGQLILTNPRDPIEDLDTLPFPDRNLIDQRLYHAQSFLNCSRRSATIYTSRGCPGRCVFCCSGHRLRSPSFKLKSSKKMKLLLCAAGIGGRLCRRIELGPAHGGGCPGVIDRDYSRALLKTDAERIRHIPRDPYGSLSDAA